MDAYADLSSLGLSQAVKLASGMRAMSHDCASVEELADRLCRYLHEHLVDDAGSPQTVLVRCYVTVPFGALPPDDQAFVRRSSAEPEDLLTCLALLGTAGMAPDANDRRAAGAHRVLPLTCEEQVAGKPMVAALLGQLGVQVEPSSG